MDSNVGSKIMKMMGWKGGGLGKTEQGISSPVMLVINIYTFLLYMTKIMFISYYFVLKKNFFQGSRQGSTIGFRNELI